MSQTKAELVNGLSVNTAAADTITVDSSGRVGINNASPQEILHVKAASETVSSRDGVIFGSTDSLAADKGLPLVWAAHIGTDADYGIANICGRKENATNDNGAGYLQFGTGNDAGAISEKMRITASGKVLHNRTTDFTMGGDPVDYQFEQITNNAYTVGIHCDNTNQRGIGIYYTTGKTTDPFFLSRVGNSLKTIIRGDGDLENANNSYGSISDVSMKENIVDANSQWDDIKNIKVRNYNFKESTGQQTHTQIGVIAQELETVSPKLVRESEDGIKTVSYSLLYMKAVKALQEAQSRIETLETKVAALEAA